jgi:hypothetical protein
MNMFLFSTYVGCLLLIFFRTHIGTRADRRDVEVKEEEKEFLAYA